MTADACARLLILFCLLFALGACQANQQADSVQAPAETPTTQSDKSRSTISPLITVDELQKLVDTDTSGIKILEPAADLAAFSKGHLPGAQYVDWVKDMTDPKYVARYNNPTAEQFTQRMSKLGISNDDRIIIYDRLNSRLSTRLFWTLKYFGHEKVQILDGGYPLWKSKSFPLSTKTSEAVGSKYKVTAMNKKLLAEMKLVNSKLKDPNARLVDGRPVKQFSGEEPGLVFHTKKAHSRKGHIPGAANVFWANNFNEDGTFKSAKELRNLYADANIKPSNDVITYCNEGLHAAPPWFVLTQLLDYKNVRLYDSSMAEWAESELPMKSEALDDN